MGNYEFDQLIDHKYHESFEDGADWQLTRCVEIVSSVIRLQTMVNPEDEKVVKKLKAVIAMMECGE